MPRYARYTALAVALSLVVVGSWLGLREAPASEGAAVSEPLDIAAETAPAALHEDVEIFRQKLALARSEAEYGPEIGEMMVRLGADFLGTTYLPHTLDPEGPERLVINLRELDCVTFVENVLALARLARAGVDDFDEFRRELTSIRYRHGILDGYTSRLHYFSDWIADNERKGLVRDVTRELGGVLVAEPVDFMSRNSAAYSKLAGPAKLSAIRSIEEELSSRGRYYIPQVRIAEVAAGIRDGDVIAATSGIRGLDVAHTGLALWVDGELHLLHAPLVGSSVEISAVPLADRILRIEGQSGIMVARPL